MRRPIVRIYLGQTRSSSLIARLLMYGWGEMTARGELPPRRHPWAYDNGAFGDWKVQRPFDADAFQRDVDRIVAEALTPDFLVVPDIVAGGSESLDFSLSWLPRLRGVAPLYLAVQDGMKPESVADFARQFAGFFVGGSLRWKLRTGEQWVRFAHTIGLPCHVGRVGTRPRVRWARGIGADSIDSCLPLWSEANLAAFIDGLAKSAQMELALCSRS